MIATRAALIMNFKNVHNDRRAVLYLNDCDCAEELCREKATFIRKKLCAQSQPQDMAVEFLIRLFILFCTVTY
ncbi:putative DNA-directed RNA polymerase [Helianthus annuus]|uniref:DNA-directed RNA polymerase n=1 Tax=Helianthus annuus TaxID=4232 RepID=A0A251VE58_HELAN|nr:putative DNA-directed RNA polymerase [Helianthus annuus]KAJ0604115.1 putative DNA-directed RNA polymerase [Helianthus annuus]KAJ0618119.1 putative DNA-directed RNA polymerase [Helianthus annuus]KAJ0776590.1 putative DNA-directed RNA polymerase [Helianthus annuus]KAJ0951024.1 putative DNA-directed RNA polymerase [Helianthus annuus]